MTLRDWLPFLLSFVGAIGRARDDLALENAALRAQLEMYERAGVRPEVRESDRRLWAWLVEHWPRWRDALVVVRPETVLRWHRRLYGRPTGAKPRAPGRPRLDDETIALIRRLSADNPRWGEDRIADELHHKLGVSVAASTVRRYLPPPAVRRGGQSWGTFLSNHAAEILACDFVTVPLLDLRACYVLVVLEHATRRVVCACATTTPTLAFVEDALRRARAAAPGAAFLVHDNDGIFGQLGPGRRRAEHARCSLDLWLRTMGIEGLPIPLGAPDANAVCERFLGGLRREALDHFVFVSPAHVQRVLDEHIGFYNHARPHQGLDAIPDPAPGLASPPAPVGRVFARPVLNGLQHDYRRAGA